MDKSTRIDIQRATQALRTVLERAFSEQLEGTYDILLDGSISEQPGSHLTERQKVTREKLIAAVSHKRSAGLEAKEAVDAYLREAAFTTLNRFVALKMLEARELVQECVAKGEDSSGFKEFTALAPGLTALPDKGYRLYIETLFDEIGQEIKVLFDRHDVASLLWPDRHTLLELLSILNALELASVWAEDETIGWVYQYFNGDEERSKMRAESQAPRNSRELAVRNQFFTPRYVVQFLTDNTLGRTWYEMMQGETKLAHLEYLIRRQNEVFLTSGEVATESETDDSDLSQEEQLQQTIYVPFRAKKDPRDLRILDPACGSGHFLIYAFGLLVTTYEEAWGDAGAATFTETGNRLREDFGSFDELRHAMPELILRHNLHGVDIDSRAAQIAALALWMRAQRAYNQFDVDRGDRAPIIKTNIVVAEPMPGDAELVDEFAVGLKPAVLGDLFKKMVQEMKLAGELGSLLKIEESIAKTVKEAAEANRQGSLFSGKVESQNFWDTADKKIIAALGSFAESVGGGAGIRRKLFAEDAAHGVAFIELMRMRFDVILMNPPFGLPVHTSQLGRDGFSGAASKNLACAFSERSYQLHHPTGMVGAIVDRTVFQKSSYEPFRDFVLESWDLLLYGDLGVGVLDGANVMTACFIAAGRAPGNQGLYLDARPIADKAAWFRKASVDISSAVVYLRRTSHFLGIPYKSFAYWLPPESVTHLFGQPSIMDHGFRVGNGLQCNDVFRFVRIEPELPRGAHAKRLWRPLYNGGSYSCFYMQNLQYVLWEDHGLEIKNKIICELGDNPSRFVKNEEMYFGRGLAGGKRGEYFDVHFMPEGMIFSNEGQAFQALDQQMLVCLLGYLNTAVGQNLVNVFCGQHKGAGYLKRLPVPRDLFEPDIDTGIFVRRCASLKRRWCSCDELGADFSSPLGPAAPAAESFNATFSKLQRLLDSDEQDYLQASTELSLKVDGLIGDSLATELRDSSWTETPRPVDTILTASPALKRLRNPDDVGFSLVQYAVGVAFGWWDVSSIQRSPPMLEADWYFDPPPANPPALASNLEDGHVVLVDDPGHEHDLANIIFVALSAIAGESFARDVIRIVCDRAPLSKWIADNFYERHLQRYTRHRRKAPIYWQLATHSASYSVWCCYHFLTHDTFFRVANDYVTPKVDHEESKLNALRQEAGPDPSSKQRKAIDAQDTFVAELRAFATEVARIAPLWNPNRNDGVIINFAPLWRLVPQHKTWQKECKKVWDKVVKGEYDWAHLAMHLWPERVVPKCKDDRSLAIAHGLEDDFWHENDDGKWQKRKVSSTRIDEFVAERSSTAVKAALKNLLEAPAAAGQSHRRRRARA